MNSFFQIIFGHTHTHTHTDVTQNNQNNTLLRRFADAHGNENFTTCIQWRIQGAGGHAPPLAAWKKFFCQYINIITKPTAYDGPWEY